MAIRKPTDRVWWSIDFKIMCKYCAWRDKLLKKCLQHTGGANTSWLSSAETAQIQKKHEELAVDEEVQEIQKKIQRLSQGDFKGLESLLRQHWPDEHRTVADNWAKWLRELRYRKGPEAKITHITCVPLFPEKAEDEDRARDMSLNLYRTQHRSLLTNVGNPHWDAIFAYNSITDHRIHA